MKTALMKTTLLITMLAVLSACSGGSKLSSSSGGGTNTGTGTPPPPDDNGGTPTTPTGVWPFTVGGDTAVFYPSWEEMNQYFLSTPINAPSNPMVNVDLKPVSGLNIYYGTVRIGFTDNGQFRYSEVSVGNGMNVNCKNCQNNDTYEAAWNYWANVNGVPTLMAYLQDKWGAVIIVLEQGTSSSPDAEGGAVLNGRIFYRNFAYSLYPQSSDRKCWYLYSGPYACFTQTMSQRNSSTSIDGYRLMGSFQGLKYKAIGQ